MPVAKGPTFDARSAAIFGGIAVVAALVIGFAAVTLANRSDRLILGDVDFRDLDAQNMADEIAERGPILWPDVASGNRDIWLNHLGDDPGDGWVAFEARVTGSSRDCNVVWSPEDDTFTDPCTDMVYPADGVGLDEIPVYIDGRDLVIDINGVRDPDDFAGFDPDA